MAIDLTPGFIYFLESEVATNQDWIAGGATTIDLTLFTEGTEYCKIEIPKRWKKGFHTGIIVTDSGGGTTYSYNTGRKGYNILPMGLETSVANADLVEKFFMISAHNTGVITNYYMVIIFTATVFATFVNAADASKDFCPVVCIGGDVSWSEAEPQIATVRLQVRSIWTS